MTKARFIEEEHNFSPCSSPPTHIQYKHTDAPTHHPGYAIVARTAWKAAASQVSHHQHNTSTAEGRS